MTFVRWGGCHLLAYGARSALLYSLFFTPPAQGAGESSDKFPAPIVVPSSQTWDGNDGPVCSSSELNDCFISFFGTFNDLNFFAQFWSTFTMQIGNPPQTVKVFASTASNEIWAIAPEGCQSLDPIDCHKLRGEIYNSNDSSTWESNLSNISNNIYPLDLGSALGYEGRGRYGFDDITLGYIGSGGPSLKNQTIAGIATKSFFMGLFGLNPRSSNFTSFNNPIPSFTQNLRNKSMIPSQSWAYTAGNKYRLSNVFGSLVLGGYDSSRFTANNLTFPLDVDIGLAAGLASVTTGEGVSLLPSPLESIYLDSTIPYIYLPVEACTLFENAFGLTWNDTAQLYLQNETQHSALKNRNPSITFKLGVPPTTVDITLPYSAFDLTASWPLVTEPTSYFPLKRALNETQYVLGRAFFQEAYVIADYEGGNFSVSQCKWDSSLPQNIVSILPRSNGTKSTTPSHTLPTGAIAGIGVGGAAAIIAGALIFYLCCFKRGQKKPAELDGNPVKVTVTKPEEFTKPELDGTAGFSPPIHEAGSKTVIAPVEIGDTGVHQVHELPTREYTRAGTSRPNQQRFVG